MVRCYTLRQKDKKYTEGVIIDRTLGNKVLDLTDYKPNPKLQYNEGEFRGTLDKNKANASVFIAVPESDAKELTDGREDLYEKYNSQVEPDADDFLINSGATIISSSITLTDSSGSNHTFVRRDNDRV